MTEYIFRTDLLQFKSKDKKYYVEGYISTRDKDLYNDIVTDECLNDMVNQLNSKNIKLDVDHEAWRKSSRIIPVGKVIEARKDEKGIFVRAVLNNNTKRFKEVWGSIKDKFLDAFSIAYKVIKTRKEMLEDELVRVLERVELTNIALTGNPVNPNAKMVNVFMKSLKETNYLEDNTMEDDNKKPEDSQQEEKGTDYKKMYEEMKAKYEKACEEKENLKKKEEDDKEEVKKKSLEQDEKVQEKEVEVKSLKEDMVQLKSLLEEKDKSLNELKAKVEEFMDKPELKSIMDNINKNEESPDEKQEAKPGYLF